MANRRENYLTAANIRYLIAVKEIDPEGIGVRCVDVAARLRLSRPSVHNMLDTLVGLGLMSRSAAGVALLTEKGEAVAEQYTRYFGTVSAMLSENFAGLEKPETAACALMAEMPMEQLETFVLSRRRKRRA